MKTEGCAIYPKWAGPALWSLLAALLLCWSAPLLAQGSPPPAAPTDAPTPGDAPVPVGAPSPGDAKAPGDSASPADAAALQGEVTLTQRFSVEREGVLTPVDPNASSPPEATVGDPLVVSLEVIRPAGTSLTLPAEQATGRFELIGVERRPTPPQPGDTTLREEIDLRFAVYRPGRYTLETFELKVMDADGGVATARTTPVSVRIVSVVANEKDPQMPPPRDPVSVEVEDWSLVWTFGIFFGLLLAGGLGAWVYRTLNPPPPPPPPPPRPAHEIALEKLGAIAAANLIAQGEVESFYVRVSEAVREYLGRRYNLSLTDHAGLELTTEELLADLREVRWPRGVDLGFVQALLADCDFVKFARYTPSTDEADDVLRRAFQLVELTRATVLGDAALGAEGGQGAQSASQTPAAASDEASNIDQLEDASVVDEDEAPEVPPGDEAWAPRATSPPREVEPAIEGDGGEVSNEADDANSVAGEGAEAAHGDDAPADAEANDLRDGGEVSDEADAGEARAGGDAASTDGAEATAAQAGDVREGEAPGGDGKGGASA